MEDILNLLYRGELHPVENYRPMMPELIEARRAFVEHREALLVRLEEKMRKEVQELFEERTFVASYEIEDAYVQGMRLGARMAIGLLEEEKKA